MLQAAPITRRNKPRVPVDVVVPCCNEELALAALFPRLDALEKELGDRYEVTFVMIDDGSTDRTWSLLQDQAGRRLNYQTIRHEKNRGLTAAIFSGIRHARSEIVCSIDCDGSYDPRQLAGMIPLLNDDTAAVSASPYHPQGRVENVPGWRLALSKTASWLYGRVIRQRLYTYTSCFRVYRKSAVLDQQPEDPGFVGVAELLWKLDRHGEKIVECPAVLQPRKHGHSKMKVARTTVGHLQLLAKAGVARLWNVPAPLRNARPESPLH